MPYAVLSVTDKTGIDELGRKLSDLGYTILSTGGTAKTLRAAGVDVRDIAEFTGTPEMLDGRVKTLHPKIFGGILGRRSRPDHVEQMKTHGLASIDVVAVNLYDFEGTLAKDPSFEDAVENIDIGGPSLLRAAAKNHEDVAVLVDPADYGEACQRLQAKTDDRAWRRGLAAKVYRHTARYDALVADYMTETPSPAGRVVALDRVQTLRYGENAHQTASHLRLPGKGPGWSDAVINQGKELSYNNLLDLDAALGLAVDLGEISDQAHAVFIKHNNPCGAASGPDVGRALALARACDPVSAFGAVVASTKVVDEEAAKVLTEAFFEAIVAPGYTEEARSVFLRKKNLRVLELARPDAWTVPEVPPSILRHVLGGYLEQSQDSGPKFGREVVDAKVVTQRGPDDAERRAMRFAWTVAKHVRSNAIVFTTEDRVLAVGAGQMSRVDSVKICRLKAGEALEGSVVASDAFFPFRDGVDVLAEAGAKAIVQPGGSVRDEEVIAAADEHGLSMLFTGFRHFRH